MVCCYDAEASSSHHNSSQDLFSLLSHSPQQYMDMTSSSNEPQPQKTTKMKVSLDLPGYEEYLPTYVPGQLITGQLNLQIESPILVTHLRIALFGNVQVYGAGPGYPVTNGLFDYQRNDQLINYGLCIVKQDEQLVSQRDQSQTNQTKRHKSPQDRHVEKLIRQVASIEHTTHLSHGVLNHVPTKYVYQEDVIFDLESSQQQLVVPFSIPVPTSRRLSGTFHHAHYPVSYRIVALMRYKDRDSPDSKPLTCFSTVNLCLEPFFNLAQFKSRIQTSPTSQFVQCRDSVWNSVCTQLLNCGVMNMYYTSKLQMYNNNNNNGIIEAHLELPEQAFERSQYIPLQLKLANHAFANFNISVVRINIELTRRINMVCSMNEQVEGKTIQSTVIVFKSSQEKEQQLFFQYAQLAFDLSNHIQIPVDSVCTIPSASTKEIFSLGYDLMVSLDITGTVSASNFLAMNQEKCYVANQHHHIWQQDELHHNLPSEPYHHKFKTYSLHLDPLPVVVVGNSGF